MSCVEEGCNGIVLARDRCRQHYRLFRQTRMPQCSQEGCLKKAHSNGACGKHYYQLFVPKGRDKALMRNYGLTEADVLRMVEEQGGCGVCGTKDPGRSWWHVDHDHGCCPGRVTCGRCVRGILCRNCNTNIVPAVEGPHLAAALAWVFPDGMTLFSKKVRETSDADGRFR